MATKNIIIRERKEEGFNGIRYCEVIGTKWFNRCALPAGRKMQKGDVFNIYRRQYETDSEGNIKRWICDEKHGCEYDGNSIETSLAAADMELEQRYTTYPGNIDAPQPLA